MRPAAPDIELAAMPEFSGAEVFDTADRRPQLYVEWEWKGQRNEIH